MKGILIQFSAVLILSLGQLFSSFSIAWPSYALELLESDQSPLGRKITKNEGGLIGSLPMLGCLLGTILIGLVGDVIGRKKAMILSGLFFVLSWSIIATTTNVTLLLIARFIIGFGFGIQCVTSVSYVSEVGTDSTRGPLMSLSVFLYTFGTLASYVCGWLLSYIVINYSMLTLSVLSVVLTSLLKETPVFLISKGKEKEAIKSLKFYRGTKVLSQAILDELEYLRNQNAPKTHPSTDSEEDKLRGEKHKIPEDTQTDNDLSAWQTLCTSKATQRVTIICCTGFLVLVFGGTIAVAAYAGPLFAVAAPNISKHMCSIILSIAFAIGSLVATIGNGVMGRRAQMMISSGLSSAFLFILASLLRWSWGPEWLIPLVVLAYCFSFQAGVGNVPIVIVAEIVLPKVKNLVSTIAICFLSICNFIVLITFAPAVETFGLDGTFLMFAIICALITVYTFFLIPESKGLPVEEIIKIYETGILYKTRK